MNGRKRRRLSKDGHSRNSPSFNCPSFVILGCAIRESWLSWGLIVMSAKRLLRPRGQPTDNRFTVERCLKSSLPFLPDKEQDCIEMLRSKIIESSNVPQSRYQVIGILRSALSPKTNKLYVLHLLAQRGLSFLKASSDCVFIESKISLM
jgi:hypothetical protein